MVAIIKAHRVYSLTGHAIWPWEVDDILPDDWQDAFRAYAVDVDEKRAKVKTPPRKGR